MHQIESGADALQVFDSFADFVSPDQYAEFAHPYDVRGFSKIARRVPTILFCRKHPNVKLIAESGADVLSIGRCLNLAEAKASRGHKVALQRNVDHEILVTGTGEQTDRAVLSGSTGAIPSTPESSC